MDSKQMMYHTDCPVCAHTTDALLVERAGEYIILECLHCLVHFSVPFNSATINHYESSYQVKTMTWSPELELERIRFSPRYRLFFKHVRPGECPTLLDIGCGMGGFLETSREFGFIPSGIEQSSLAIKRARNFGITNIYHGSIYELPSDWNDFFVITIFEVLEHLDKPREFVHDIYERLRPGGILYITVPDRERLELRLTRERPKSDYPPNHLTRWSATALNNFLKGWGWQEVCIHRSALETTPLYWSLMARLFGSNGIFGVSNYACSGTGDKEALISDKDPIQINPVPRNKVLHPVRKMLDRFLWQAAPITNRLGLYGHSLAAVCYKI
jgi:SAM-dependent methyltransferase